MCHPLNHPIGHRRTVRYCRADRQFYTKLSEKFEAIRLDSGG